MPRDIDLSVSPTLAVVLRRWTLQAPAGPYVYGGQAPLTQSQEKSCRDVLKAKFGAPDFHPQRLRQMSATYLVNAPSIFGANSLYASSARVVHSPTVAHKRYVRENYRVPDTATTLEAAMRNEVAMENVIARLAGDAVALPRVVEDRARPA